MKSRTLFAYSVVVLLLFAAGLGARQLAAYAFLQYVRYASPFTVPLDSTAGGPPLAQRVILVVIDGLRLDAFQRMSLVERYRSRASLWRAFVGEPSLSYPGWTTILSGAPPEISGVTTNWHQGAVRVDHLFAAAKRSGRVTAAAGHPGWAMLFVGSVDEFVSVPDPAYTDLPAIHDTSVAVTAAGTRFLQGPAALVLLHYPAPDLMAHGAGATSQPYRDSVRLIDEELTRLLQGVDLTSTAVVITSDHGHIDRGGHGGREAVVRTVPLMFLGAGIEPG
ncbi:MAG: alkaline phosphatase family protein, partial [Armatimonadota bacterium]|nr:alkaline phosphatase family protein [Armatimonadota bacterium]